MGVFSMIVVIVAISVFGGILREFVKSKKDLSNSVHRDLDEMRQRIANIEADIADIKEQIADFIIKNV
jgi:predicted translin family RNA/ssDNA-binding protein